MQSQQNMDKPYLFMAENLHFQYAANCGVQGVSFALQKSEIIGILGPNGAGKSTLLKLFAGIIAPCSGQIFLRGKAIKTIARKEIARTIGFLPQTITSDFDYTVEEIAAMGRFPYAQGFGFLTKKDEEIIQRVLARLSLEKFRERRVSTLSGGERQRVFLASVLAQEPQIFFLDEPTTGMDIHFQIELLSLLQNLHKETGMAIIFVTQEINLAAMYAKRILLLQNGQIIKDDLVHEAITSETMQKIYGNKVLVATHPTKQTPIVLPS